jgi:hypothetical protein
MIKTKQISLQNMVAQIPGNIVSDMGGEKVMMNIDNGKYYNLGEIGGDIWTLIEKSISVQEVVEALLTEYQVEREDCVEQVLTFLQQLYNEKLINIE